MGAMPPDDDSYSQQMAISPEEELFDVRRIVTAHNVLCSLNVKTRVPGLIGSSRLADVGDAYRHSRLMFLGEEDGYPLSEDDGNIPLNANALLQLLCVAHRDAYGKGNPVVLLLKHEEGGARMRRRSVGAVLVVVLLGNLIEAVEKKRYGNCIVYDDVTKDYEVVVEQTGDKEREKSLLQTFGEARLFYFPTLIEEMWTKLRSNINIDVKDAVKIMDESDPYRDVRKVVQERCGVKK
ncbi:hypothetical protein COOONC_23106 [Cooperia oncophora]